ncbi:hypothetical protein D3C86_2065580 [compost metagenome]
MTLADASDSQACTNKVSVLSSGLTMNIVLGVRGVAMMLGPGSKAHSAVSCREAGSESGGFGVTLNMDLGPVSELPPPLY